MGPLLIAAAHNTPDVVRFLLTAGANVNWRDGYDGETPLMAAVDGGSLETARLLLAAGADVQITDDRGRSALWRAAGAYNTGFIMMLADHGAEIDAPDTSGMTPLMHAADLCAEWNITPLLAAGADPRVADKAGRSALSGDVAPQGDPKCKRVRSLLESAVRAR